MVNRLATHRGRDLSCEVIDIRDPWEPESAPVVLLHGIGSVPATWSSIARSLGAQRKIVLVGFPYYRADEPLELREGTDAPRLAEYVGALLRAVGVSRGHFVGESFGGSILLALAVAEPSLVSSLTTIASPIKGGAVGGSAQRRAFLESGRMNEWADLTLSGRLDPEAVPPKTWDWMRQVLGNVSPEVTLWLYDAVQRTDLTDDLGTITAPMLFLAPSNSHSVPPEVLGAIASSTNGIRLELIVGSRHGAVLSHPQECAAFIQDFLDRVDAGGDEVTR